MEITELFTELEKVFENNGLDEAWTDWMRDCTQRLAGSHDVQERTQLLLKIQEGEPVLSGVGAYLSTRRATNSSQSAASAQYQIEHLVHTLDLVIQHELQATVASGIKTFS